jgi:PIN domain nuclease of toxin-antitoxin system
VILLLDTHALVWWLDDAPTLSTDARAAIESNANDVLVSAASAWELAIKIAKGKLRLEVDLPADIEAAGFIGLSITIADAQAAASLPPHHGDPFDRILIAQAQRIDAVIVSRDAAFAAYDVNQLLA